MWKHFIPLSMMLPILLGRSIVDKDGDNIGELEDTVDLLLKELSFDKNDFTNNFNTEKINKNIAKLKQIVDSLPTNNPTKREPLSQIQTHDNAANDVVSFEEFKRRFENSDAMQKIVFNGKRGTTNSARENSDENKYLLKEIKKMLKPNYGIDDASFDTSQNNFHANKFDVGKENTDQSLSSLLIELEAVLKDTIVKKEDDRNKLIAGNSNSKIVRDFSRTSNYEETEITLKREKLRNGLLVLLNSLKQ